MNGLTAEKMLNALTRLDELIEVSCTLIVGGGGAMILAHGFPLSTMDIDAYPKEMPLEKLDVHIKQVAREQGIPVDWLNPYFSTFTHTLPPDYGSRLVEVFRGRNLKALALGKEEMLIMKCFAGRVKDVGHAKSLIKKGADLKLVEKHIESLLERRIPGSREALDFFDDLMEQL